MTNARLAWLFGSMLAACSCGGTAPATTTTPPSSQAPSAHGTADYEVHEWGLVRGGPGDTQQYGVLAPPLDVSMLSVDKPLLYFHAPAALTLASVRVEARSGGTLVETWPLAPLGATATWSNVQLDPSGACAPSPLPSATEAPCSGLASGEACESPTLASLRTEDAACVHVGESTERFLFYRGRARTFTPPLRFERTGAYEVVRVTNEGDAPIPGMLVRIASEGYRVRTLVIAPPAPHQSIDVGADFDAAATDHTVQADDRRSMDEDMPVMPTTGPGRDAAMRTMLDIGLTQSEADAFLRAWGQALFGPGATAVDSLSVDGDGTPAPRESFLYFLPAAALEDVAHLELDPAPQGGVHRAIAMWSALTPTGATH